MLRGTNDSQLCDSEIRYERMLTNSRPINPWIVQVRLASFNQQDLKLVVQVGQSEVKSARGHETMRLEMLTGQQRHIRSCHHRTR